MNQKIQKAMNLFDERIYRFAYGHGSNTNRLGYAPSRMNFPSIKDVISLTGKQKPLFLEFGCGIGRNTLLAGMLGFEAYGIEIRLDLVEHGNRYIESLKSQGIVDDSVSAKLYYGNILTRDVLRDLKKYWINRISKELKLKKSEVEARIVEQMKTSLDFLTDDEFEKIYRRKPKDGIRMQRFELYSNHWLTREAVDKRLLEVTPPFILENPYESQGLDVYDVMGKRFGDFDYFYNFAWNENELIAEMIRRQHPGFYIWQEYHRICKHSDFSPYPPSNIFKRLVHTLFKS
jgi:SAM-dependent methyltransferase